MPLSLLDAGVRGLSSSADRAAPIENFFPVAYAAAVSHRTGVPYELLFHALPATTRSADDVDPVALRSSLSGGEATAPLVSSSELDRIMDEVEGFRAHVPFEQLVLADLAGGVGASERAPLLARLTDMKVTTPAKLLALSSEAAWADELNTAERLAVKSLEDHAQLGLLNLSGAGRKALIEAGFAGPTDVASEPFVSFEQKLAPLLGPIETARIHDAASLQKPFLDFVAAGLKLAPQPALGSSSYAASAMSASGEDAADCGCGDCEAATSPAAYLADLMSYANAKLSWQYDPSFAAQPTTPSFLSGLLEQRITDFRTDCESVDQTISQMRLCIESLLALIGENLDGSPDVACCPLKRRVSFAFAADVDGDGQDELILGFDADYDALLTAREPVGTGVWVMRYAKSTGRWVHLAAGSDPTAATFYLPRGLRVKSAFAGKFKLETAGTHSDRRQLALVIEDPSEGGLPVWVLEFDATTRLWKHVNPGPLGVSVEPGGTFDPDVFDFMFAPVGANMTGCFAADIDHDGVDEFIAYGTTPTHLNAFWVYKRRPQSWDTVGPVGALYDVAFVCHAPAAGASTYPIKLALAGDVDRDGVIEIVAFPDATGRQGRSPWIMKWDAANSVWTHLAPTSARNLGADVDLGAAPLAAAHVVVGGVTGIGSVELLVAPEATVGADPNRFDVYTYAPVGYPVPDEPAFNELAPVNCSPTLDRVSFVIAADVDGDARDELVVLTRDAKAAWIMDRTTAGVWQHLSPLVGHPVAADLDWAPGGRHPASFAFAANVDGDSQDEIVVVGSDCTEIWVLKYREATKDWGHVRAPESHEGRYETAAYLALLTELGTSYDEVRLTGSGDVADRRALADRLALSLGPRTGPAGDRLDRLANDPTSITEQRIEELFGLVNTRRDALSSVAVSGDTQAQTSQWRFQGLDWSADPAASATDNDGAMYCKLALNTVTSKVTVELYRNAAQQTAVATGVGPRAGNVSLTALNGSGLSGSVKLDYKADTKAIVLTALPQVGVWQAMRLREQWDEEDWPADAFSTGNATAASPRLPIIDPDVAGPDEFRLPLPKATTASPDGAFDLWLRRRAWVDGLLHDLQSRQPDLDSMFAFLRPPASAPVPDDYPWRHAPPTAEFDELCDDLSNGDAATVERARTTLTSDLHLSVDAFVRLMALREQKLAAAPPLSDAEWEEVRSILAQAYKASRFERWRSEESAAGLRLDAESFIAMASSPSEGAWPPVSSATVPWVDPELIAITDLPLSLAGVEGRELFRRRSAELRTSADALRARRSAGLEAVLVEGLGAAPAAGPWIAWIGVRAERLQRSDAAVVTQAEADIHSALPGVSLSVFRRMAAVTAMSAAVLSESHWTDIDAGARTVRKHRLLYPTWRTEETDHGRFPYWKTRRASLPRWRAPVDYRLQWEQALRGRTRPPVMDPDSVPLAWIRSRTSRAFMLYAGGFNAGAQPPRSRELRLREDAMRAVLTAAPSALEGLDGAIVEALTPGADAARVLADIVARRQSGGFDRLLGEIFGESASEFVPLLAALNQGGVPAATAERTILRQLCFGSLDAFRAVAGAKLPGTMTALQWQGIERTLARVETVRWVVLAERRSTDTGVKVRSIVEQSGFSTSAWRRLCTTRSLAAQGTSALLPDEIDEALAILMRADKSRRYGRWRDEERGTGTEIPIRLGPDSFRVPVSVASSDVAEPSAWRVVPAEARQWRDTLDARTAQHEGLFTALRTSVARVEDFALPILRDRLVSRLPVASEASDAAMRWVGDYLLTDPQTGSCRRTTRVAHAIESMLALLWSVRNGQLSDTYPAFRLDARTFDDDWRWIGSYTTWRSAILVYLYPENLLIPSLNRRRTPAFRTLIEQLRSGTRLSSGAARQLATDYSDYLQDVCSLRLGGCVEAGTAHFPDREEHPEGAVHTVAFLFGVTSSSRVYWCMRDEHARTPDFAQSFWEPLDGFSGPVIDLIGATVQLPASGGHPTTQHPKVFVFAKVAGEIGEALEFLRYDLETGVWESDAIPLEVPRKPISFTAALMATARTSPPMLELRPRAQDVAGVQYEVAYLALNATGNGWAREDPEFSSRALGAWSPLGATASLDNPGPVAIRQIVAGDFDADGRAELLVSDTLQGADAAAANDYWLLDYENGQWSRRRNLNCSDELVAAGYAFAGDVDGDGRDELIVAVDDLNRDRFWVMRYDGAAWQHVGKSPTQLYDLNCFSWDVTDQTAQFAIAAEFAVSGRFFPGDNRDSIAVAISPGTHAVGINAVKTSTGFWVFTLKGGVWKRQGVLGLLYAAFNCCTDVSQTLRAAFAVTGDFDGDGLDEIAVAAAPMDSNKSLGNDFWVMDFRGGSWQPLGTTSGPAQSVFDLSAQPVTAAFAVAGDFDGDGRDELIVAPFVPATGTQSQLWHVEYRPGPDPGNPANGGSWKSTTPNGLGLAYVAAGAVVGDFDGDGRDEIAILPLFGNEIQIADYDVETDEWQILSPLGKLTSTAVTAFAAAGNFAGGSSAGIATVAGAQSAQSSSATWRGDYVGNAFVQLGPYIINKYVGSAQNQKSVSASLFVETQPLAQCSCVDFKPDFAGPYTVRERADSPTRRALVAETLAMNRAKPLSQQTYLHEAFYSVPLQIALALQRAHDYAGALDWFRLVYDYSQPIAERKIYTALDEVEIGGTNFVRDLLQWVQDPTDPHAIASARPGTYARGTLLLLIRCLLDYADAEFTQDTSEAIERARILYDTALELLRLPELDQRLGVCEDVIARIPLVSTEPALVAGARTFSLALPAVGSARDIATGADAISAELDRDDTPIQDRLSNAEHILATALSGAGRDTAIGAVLERARSTGAAQHRRLLQDEGVAHSVAALAALGALNGGATTNGSGSAAMAAATVSHSPNSLPSLYALNNKHGFCVGPNPMLKALRFHAEVSLFKIRTCRNIAGMRRSLDLYSSPTDQTSGLPVIGLDGQLVLPQSGPLIATPYRYSALIQRAKELAGHAQQMEGLLLAALERRDAEALTLLRSRQEIQVARAAVRVQELRITAAQDRVSLAELQQERAAIEGDHYQQLLDAGELDLELDAIGWLEQATRYIYAAAGFEGVAAMAHSVAASAYSYSAVYAFLPAAISSAVAGAAGSTAAAASATASALSSLSQAASTWSQIRQIQASRERTRQEWQLRVQLALQDQRIGDQQIRVETDQVRIAQQEFAVSDLQADNADAMLDFHMQKFTNLDLYDWMSGILERTYSFMLQQAAAMAQLAARQVAFERQEGLTPAIHADYWQPAADGPISANGDTAAQDRRGLTGSARLLQDIVALDQWAFDSNTRKLQLSKTFSLAQLVPLDFEQLRTTGVMTFNTPTGLFDYDFPGHYLRLIKRVSVSVAALTPPGQGIHATLSNTGVSRVVVGPDVFQTTVVRRQPETIALTSPIGSTGVFAFEAQSEFANPFESQGVDTTWELRMPKAGNFFDYTTLADVLLTIDYTALDSVDYRVQVTRQLDRRFVGDRAFSMRSDFADAWWDLHNPDQQPSPFATHFEIRREDFPPNLEDLEIAEVSLLFVAGTAVPTEAVPAGLKFTETGATTAIGGSATPVDHLVSTRRANGGSWRQIIGKIPAGRWDLTLVDSTETREWFEGDDLLDILIVVSYAGRTPAWPA
ncbi:FG-GAP-like repeat-containing protein [Solirubrobacter ginsenosidimutans]|uniref:FG-GAP-like repeat-containing protein n=1 Tax=Solirubrobacter ginsenosidimutans TaxID=490573 RepID=A0A9X3MPZ3_9ACTN|nr:FG-GAP-like repeat-containing protein [Solirubrobacter ginsenosidimutans]MDA0160165.1 FG-GAP-like repeat-containing protein [Solirubrobacter ginsenosidimutans]